MTLTRTLAAARTTTFAGIVNAVSGLVKTWSERRQTRRALARLDSHLLRDIGLDEATAGREAIRHFFIE
jgi:uncharacterized protein YjiS (DUF1127 family)